jgi:dephospho-CoA kinase
MRVIGLTGGIGTGKSRVARILEELGAVVVNADLLGHQAYEPNTETWQQIVDAFGPEVVSPGGEIDRKRLGRIVFSSPSAKSRLDAIVWPQIAILAQRRIDNLLKQETDRIVLEAAVLVEAGWDYLVDEVWVTRAPRELVRQRLKLRDGLTTEEIDRRIDAQIPFEERLKEGYIPIENASTPEALRDRVQTLWRRRIKESAE